MEKYFKTLKALATQKFQRRREVDFLIQFQDFLISEKYFEFCGFPFLRRVEARGDKIRKIHTAMTQVVGILIAVLSAVSCIHFAQFHKLEASIENICYVVTYITTLMRFFYVLFYHRQTLTEIIETLDEYYPHHGLDQHFHGVRKYLREIRVISWITRFFYFFSVTQFSIFIFEVKIYGWLTSKEVPWMPMHEFWFPFDDSKPFAYAAVHIIQIWSLAATVFILLAFDMFFACLTILTSMELDILAQKISEAENYEELKKFVKIHQELLEVTKKMEKVFSPLLLANICTSISILCVAAFLANIGTSNTFLMIKYAGGFFLAFVHGFVQCHFSQRIIDSSESIGYAAYSIPWFGTDVKFQKLILIIRMRANMPQKLTAWKFFDVSMETYYWVLTISHSYYSFLTGVYA